MIETEKERGGQTIPSHGPAITNALTQHTQYTHTQIHIRIEMPICMYAKSAPCPRTVHFNYFTVEEMEEEGGGSYALACGQ